MRGAALNGGTTRSDGPSNPKVLTLPMMLTFQGVGGSEVGSDHMNGPWNPTFSGLIPSSFVARRTFATANPRALDVSHMTVAGTGPSERNSRNHDDRKCSQ